METVKDNSFFYRRLHSLLGIVPLGLFILEHFFTNSFAMQGAKVFDDKIEFFATLPYLIVIELVFIFIPLLIHGLYGLYIVYTGQANQLQQNHFRNWMYLVQRVTGVILLFYIGWHVWTTRLSALLYGKEVSFDMMHKMVTSPLVFWWMVIGVVCVAIHFANGIWSFCIVWGITIGERAQQRMGYAVLAFAFVLAVVGIIALRAFVG